MMKCNIWAIFWGFQRLLSVGVCDFSFGTKRGISSYSQLFHEYAVYINNDDSCDL